MSATQITTESAAGMTLAQRAARETLTQGKALLVPALRSAVDTLSDPIRRIAAYHFGWQDEHGQPSTGDSGKALRPTLALLTAEVIGGDAAAAVPAAVAVELAHNFSLLHDDIMDGDTHRRHRPTAWTVFGAGEATLAGDALLTLAIHTLALSKHPAAPVSLRILTAAVHELLSGQGDDLQFERQDTITYADYRTMAQRKTGALLAAACALGALAGGGSSEQVEHLHAFGEHLGLAFQFVDDMLSIWGDPVVTGKPATTDIRRRKKSLPVVLALAADVPESRELALLYRCDQPLSDSDIAHAANLIEATDARNASQQHTDTELAQALQHLRAVNPNSETGTLHNLAYTLAHRDR